MRFVPFLFFLIALAFGPAFAAGTQNAPAVQPRDQYFSGTVTAITDTQITVSRTVLGKEPEIRTFSITPDTRVEGKPRVKSRVTVRFDGDHAVHILVRASQKKAS